MSAVSLTDQMGAMALIDELRHAQLEVQKHLDLPARRRAVAERIREFYKSKGMSVDDALVEQGVKEYFASRLTYEARKVGALQGLLGRIYITRAKWSMPLGASLVLGLAIALGGNYALERYDQYLLEKTQALVATATLGKSAMTTDLLRQQNQIIELEAGLKSTDPVVIRHLIERVKMTFGQIQGLATAHVPGKVKVEDRLNVEGQLSVALPQIDEARRILRANEQLLDSVSAVRAAEAKLQEIVSQPGFAAKAKATPKIQAALDRVRKSIDNADQPGVMAEVRPAIIRLSGLLIDQMGLQSLWEMLAELRKEVAAMKMSQADNDQFEPLFGRIQDALTDLDNEKASSLLATADRMQAYAAKPLSLNVVSRAHEKSMVERNYDSTGGKSWYLLTEATDTDGHVVPVAVVNSETGRTVQAKVFGVRVEHATYMRARADKEADGHVDDRAMGKKAANTFSLTFNSNRAVIGRPDMITEW